MSVASGVEGLSSVRSPTKSATNLTRQKTGAQQPEASELLPEPVFTGRKLTPEEFLPIATRSETRKLELVGGKIVPMSPVSVTHGLVQMELAVLLGSFLREHQLGRAATEVGIVLNFGDTQVVRGPDLAFWSQEKLAQLETDQGFTRVVPDLVVEVVSPHDSWGYLLQKVLEYLAAGVRLVWIADPETRSVTVWRPNLQGAILRTDDTLQGEDVLTGFSSPVARIFA
ncbi:MAG: Uma2 family endonuclease [Gemmatales bacterium]|nr:Uma2 family endonuclease [Gemmatales bacterium]